MDKHSLAAHSMSCIVKPHYHVFNKWFTKHLLGRRAGHETVWSTRPPYKCLEPLNTFPVHVYFKSNRPWKSSRRLMPGPLCTGRILFPIFFVLVTDLGTAGREQHALVEKVICMLMYLPVLFAHFQLFVWTTRQQCFFLFCFFYLSWSVRHIV